MLDGGGAGCSREAPEAITKGFWSIVRNVVRCVGGTAPGGWSGALVGVAEFCL